jgi:hypothetical protein
MKVLFFIVFTVYWKSIALHEGSQASTVYPSDNNSIKMQMAMEHWWNDTDGGKLKYWERNIIQHWWNDTDGGKLKYWERNIIQLWWNDTDGGKLKYWEKNIIQHWWNDTDGGKVKYWERNLSHCHFVQNKFTWTLPGWNPVLRGERPATK